MRGRKDGRKEGRKAGAAYNFTQYCLARRRFKIGKWELGSERASEDGGRAPLLKGADRHTSPSLPLLPALINENVPDVYGGISPQLQSQRERLLLNLALV